MAILIAISISLNMFFIILTAIYYWRAQDAKKDERRQKLKEVDELRIKLNYFIHQVELAKTLRDIYMCHIRLWASGIHHENFGPNEYGMFRTDDILMMTPNEVYLGNIWGLNTKTLIFWENQEDDCQKLVIEQYKNVLISNMNWMLNNL